MNAERKKILEMLAEGKITAEEADKLLEKISAGGATEAKADEPVGAASAKPRYVRIVVDKPGQEQVNVRLPLAFMGKGSNLLAVLPPRVNEKLAELGIDLAAARRMDDKEWSAFAENLNIDIDKGSKKVRIFCE